LSLQGNWENSLRTASKLLADRIIQEQFATTTDGDWFFCGGVPPDGSHVIAYV